MKPPVARIVVTCSLLALLANGAGAQRPQHPLTDAQRELYARLLLMADTRTLDTAAVDQALVSTSMPLASFAALSVGQLGRAEAAPRLSRLRLLLIDPRADVAAAAAYSLGLLRDTAGVGALTYALSAPDDRAWEAAWALGQLGEPARRAIVYGLGVTAQPAPVRVQLLLAASRLRPVPLDVVLPGMRDSSGAVAWAAAYAIARPRVPEGVGALMDALSYPTARDATPTRVDFPYALGASAPYRIRAEIARGLARSAAGDSLADTAFAVLTGLARDDHPHVRINALRSLATFDDRARALLVAGASDPDANARIAAVQALAGARALGDVDWAGLWTVDTSFTYRRYLLEAAAAHGTMLPALDAWASGADWHGRSAAGGAAAAARDFSIVRDLAFRLAADSDPRVRGSALGALTADTARVTDTVRVVIRSMLTDQDEIVRAAALGALNRSPRAADVPLVIAALERAIPDVESDARVAALGYLTAAWRRDSAAFTAGLRDRLAALPPPDDPVARAAAVDLPPLAAWAAARIQPRPVAWYQEVVDRLLEPTLAGRPPAVTVRTTRGPITLELFAADAPLTVNNFLSLARRRYYDGLSFHRVVPNFVVQDGDPRGDGSGGPGYSIRDELNRRRYERGVLGMALSGPDTGGSQYFITHAPQPHLDGGYTVFGRVTAGWDALDALVQGDSIVAVVVH